MDKELQLKQTFAQRLEKLLSLRGYPELKAGRNVNLATNLHKFGENVQPSTVYKWLKGQIPSPYYLKILAEELRTTSDYLLGLSDVPDNLQPSKLPISTLKARWHPVDKTPVPFNIPAPKLPQKVDLAGLWANRLGHDGTPTKELVIFDQADKTLQGNQLYLASYSGVLHPFTVERHGPYLIRLWDDGGSMFYETEMAHFQDGNAEVLGRVVWRLPYP